MNLSMNLCITFKKPHDGQRVYTLTTPTFSNNTQCFPGKDFITDSIDRFNQSIFSVKMCFQIFHLKKRFFVFIHQITSIISTSDQRYLLNRPQPSSMQGRIKPWLFRGTKWQTKICQVQSSNSWNN